MAAPPITTSVTELPESRVRVEAEVPAAEVEKRVEQAARSLARSIRVPGFRAGKAPAPVVIKRVGREAVLDEAVRDSIGALVLRRHRRGGDRPGGRAASSTWASCPPPGSR